ncbi:MAG: right-handed parallel beta-helix repeat-containing protein [Deltaproteobacteria bacterium]|nr:right-handed parallel beta-helix repeat-containing protein [Deltaproteobacteria bacterium]MBW2535298.1 right-handed parallel beta-helix repeat-containing protein [Deltaproteobacteria bacterium]
MGVLTIGAPASAVAATYYVSESGVDTSSGTAIGEAWRTIDRVNSAALSAGDQVLFRAGDTWMVTASAGRLQAQSGVTYSRFGTGENPLIDGGGTAPTDWRGLVEAAGVTDVTIDGIDVTGSGVFGVMSTDSSRIVIRNLKADYTNGSGVVSIRGTDVTIDNVEVAHVLDHPHESITISGTDGFVLSNSYIHDGAFAGLDMKSNARNGVVFGNELTGTNNDPILYFERCESIEAYGNYIHTTPEAGTHKALVSFGVEPLGDPATHYNRNIDFHHNTLFNGHGVGVNIWIKEGVAEGGADERVQHDIRIRHNTVVQTNTEGVAWNASVTASDNRASPDPSDWSGILIENNILWDNGTSPGVNLRDGITATVRNNLYESAETGELGADPVLTADVRFVDLAGGDYHLQADSPAIGAAHDGSDVGRYPYSDASGGAGGGGGAGGNAAGGAAAGGSGASGGGGAAGVPDPPTEDTSADGCGCRTVGGTSRASAVIVPGLLWLLATRRRRRRR